MRRRGFGLILVLAVMTLVGTALTLMALHVGQLARQRQHDRARTFAQVVLDSGVAYARSHRGPVATAPNTTEVALPTEGLLPAPARASLTLQPADDGSIRVIARVDYGRAHATEEAVIATTVPASRPRTP